jgi:hypothetical protein
LHQLTTSSQNITLDFESACAKDWTQAFEDILHGEPTGKHYNPETQDMEMPKSIYFNSPRSIDEEFAWVGRIHSIPPQAGIPGWQRLVMVKFDADLDDPGIDDLWAYEGVVLPGSHMILGRWWFPGDDPLADGGSYCGPFIFWQGQRGL